MPTIPRLGINQVAAAQGPQQRVDTSVNQEAFGLGNARSVAPDIAAFAQKIKNDADQVAAMEAENKLIEYQNKFLYDPKDGMIAKKGKDAFNLQNDLNESFAKTNAEIGETLSNPVQRALFEKAAAGRRMDMESQTNKYMSSQIQQYDDETTEANVLAERNNAANVYQDPDLLAKSMIRQQQAIAEYGARHGLSPEVVKSKVDDTISKTHTSVISRMLTNGDDLTAESYYNANKDGVLGLQKEAVEKELMIGTTKGKTQRFSDEAMAKGLSETQAYALAAKTYADNPKLREAAEQRLSYVYTMKKRGDEEYQQRLYDKAAEVMDRTGSLDSLDPKMISAMKPETVKSLDTYRDQNPVRADGVKYYQLKQLSEDPSTRKKFIEMDLTTEFGNLNKEERNDLIRTQAGLRKNDGKTIKQLDGALSDSQVLKDVFVQAGFDPKDDKMFARYRQGIDSEVLAAQEAKGRKLNNEELRNIAYKSTEQKIVTKGFFWGESKQAEFEIDVEDIIFLRVLTFLYKDH